MTPPPGAGSGLDRAAAGHEDDCYTSQHVSEALARDPRVGELGLEVELDGDEVHVSGNVTTEQRRAAVPDVVHDALPDAKLRNDVSVLDCGEEPEVERLA